MPVYLPIAELPVDMFFLLAMGAGVGFISGMFGVGGGFLLAPLLIFAGIPPHVSVATVTSQVVASSASGVLAQWRRRAIDVKLALFFLVPGMTGAVIGIVLFDLLRDGGQLDLVIALSYVVFLGIIGSLMLVESAHAIIARLRASAPPPARRSGRHNWIHGLPFKVRFRRSRIYVSAIPIVMIGIGVGLLGTMLGIGGGFIMVPALIYLFHVPGNIVVGTSLLQILVIMAVATILHAASSLSVDIVLAVILMVGGVIGAQLGVRIGQKVRSDILRLLLALIIFSVALRFAAGLLWMPGELFSVSLVNGSGL